MESSSKEFALRIDSAPKATLYLAVSWQPDQGKTFGYQLVKRLDDKGILAVGDPKGFETMDPARLSRVMRGTNGFLSVLPYRPDNDTRTSGFMLEEIRLAIECGLPIAILCDKRIEATGTVHDGACVVRFINGATVSIPGELARFVKDYEPQVEQSEESRLVELGDFVKELIERNRGVPSYSFLVTRLQPDFELPRRACAAAAERAAGIPCLWIDSPGYSTNIDDTIERAQLLIRHSAFVVAEISIAEENPTFDNPSRAHEIGSATAYGKKVYPVSHDPRRHPYHALVASQVVWWSDEQELFQDLQEKLHAERAAIGRHIYNWEIRDIDENYTPKFLPREFSDHDVPAWRPPANLLLSSQLSWVYAISFGLIVGCVALLLRRFVGYEDTLDFVAIFAGLTTVLFSSKLHDSILKVLNSKSFLQWLIPLIAVMVLCATIIALRPSPST